MWPHVSTSPSQPIKLHFVPFAEDGCESEPAYELASKTSDFLTTADGSAEFGLITWDRARLECSIGDMCLEFTIGGF